MTFNRGAATIDVSGQASFRLCCLSQNNGSDRRPLSSPEDIDDPLFSSKRRAGRCGRGSHVDSRTTRAQADGTVRTEMGPALREQMEARLWLSRLPRAERSQSMLYAAQLNSKALERLTPRLPSRFAPGAQRPPGRSWRDSNPPAIGFDPSVHPSADAKNVRELPAHRPSPTA